MRVVSRTIQLDDKYPKEENLGRGTVSIYQYEIDEIVQSDTIFFNVFDLDSQLVATPVYTYAEFKRAVKRWKKNVDGHVKTGYYLSFIEY
jgi:hypothetical protein